jgi:hypothetical protein
MRRALLLVLAIACSHRPAAADPNPKPQQPLVARLTITREAGDGPSLAVTVVITNTGSAPVTIDTRWFGYPFILRARDAAGKPVPQAPPPVPDDRKEPTTIAPGKSIKYDYDGIFATSLPKGHYEIHFAGNDTVASPWVPFDVK